MYAPGFRSAAFSQNLDYIKKECGEFLVLARGSQSIALLPQMEDLPDRSGRNQPPAQCLNALCCIGVVPRSLASRVFSLPRNSYMSGLFYVKSFIFLVTTKLSLTLMTPANRKSQDHLFCAQEFLLVRVSNRPSLRPSGQSFWLQMQRSRVRFPALPDFQRSSVSGTGSTQPREYN
jgi:hypothetical protein